MRPRKCCTSNVKLSGSQARCQGTASSIEPIRDCQQRRAQDRRKYLNERVAACCVRDDCASEIESKPRVHPFLEVWESRHQQERSSYQFRSSEKGEEVVRIAKAASPFEKIWCVTELLNAGDDHSGRQQRSGNPIRLLAHPRFPRCRQTDRRSAAPNSADRQR